MIRNTLVCAFCMAVSSAALAGELSYSYLDYSRIKLEDTDADVHRYGHRLTLHGQLERNRIYRLGLSSTRQSESYSIAGGVNRNLSFDQSAFALAGIEFTNGADLYFNVDGGVRTLLFDGVLEVSGAMSVYASDASDDGGGVTIGARWYFQPDMSLGLSIDQTTDELQETRLSIRFQENRDPVKNYRVWGQP